MHYLEIFKYCPVCGSSHFAENDFKSKRCDDCGFVFYHNSAAAVSSIIENERGELLMGRRACEPAKGTLDIVGGFVDPEESLTQAMVREMKEETGVTVREEELQFLFSIPNVYEYSQLTVHTCDAFFKLTIPSDTELKPQDDVAELIWMKIDDIKTEEIGLRSIRQAVEQHIALKKNR